MRRPIVGEGDLEAMFASKPAMASAVATSQDAASGVIEAILAGERYVITHGDLVQAIEERSARLSTAAEEARSG